MNRQTIAIAAVFSLALALGCRSEKSTAPNYAFVTNGVADFWRYAEAGARAAGRECGAEITVVTPNGMTDQTRKIEDLITRGTEGIAITVIDPANQGATLNKAAAATNLITHDSDAPDSNRLVYIGMDNYDAGIMCGETLRKAMPDGGSVVIYIGRMDQDNAKRRRQGFIDGLFGRKPDATRNDPGGDEVKSDDGKFTVLRTMTDQFDFAKAKANVEDTITSHPDIAGMVGLFEYNPPLILEALERTGRLGKVKVMAFDENPATLQGIKDGNVVGTIVQNPYQYGYKSILVLNELHKGNKSVIPENKFIDIPARVITFTNVDAFAEEAKSLLEKK